MKGSYKVMLHPNKKQETKLFQYAGAARFAYNWTLDKQMKNFSEGRPLQNNRDLRKEFTIIRNSEEYSWMLSISNNVTKQAIKDCCDAYSKFFKKQKRKGYVKYTKKKLARIARQGKTPTPYDMNGHPKFKSKKNGNFRFFQDTAKIKFSETHVKLEGLADSKKKNRKKLNWVRLAEPGRIPVGAKYTNPRITFDGINWWISIGIQSKRRLRPLRNLKFSKKFPISAIYSEGVGIDLGIKDLAVCSNEDVFENINKTKKVRKLKKKQRRLQRQVSRKYLMNKKGESYCKTSNIIKCEKELLRIYHKLTDIRQNYIHQITTSIMKRKPSFICIEDLNVQGMMSNKHLSKAVQEQKLYEFRRQIEYKGKWNNVPVVIADRWFPSSKTCMHCGHIKKDLKLSDRTYVCPVCGHTVDRDLQAAINLKVYGENELHQLAS